MLWFPSAESVRWRQGSACSWKLFACAFALPVRECLVHYSQRRQHLKTKVYFCSEKARIINTIIHGLQCFCLSFSDDVSCSNNPPTCFVCEMGGHSRRSLRMSWCLQQKVSGSRGWQRAVLEADLQSSPFSPFFVENNPLWDGYNYFSRCVGFRPTKTVLLNIGISTRALKVKVQLLQDCGDRMNVSCTLTIEGRGFPKFHDVLFFWIFGISTKNPWHLTFIS